MLYVYMCMCVLFIIPYNIFNYTELTKYRRK